MKKIYRVCLGDDSLIFQEYEIEKETEKTLTIKGCKYQTRILKKNLYKVDNYGYEIWGFEKQTCVMEIGLKLDAKINSLEKHASNLRLIRDNAVKQYRDILEYKD